MSTRAIAYLNRKKVPFDVVKYDHEEKGAEFAAKAVGFALEATIKTLVVDLGEKGHILALAPGHRQLDLKKLARICGVKRAAMADTATAERVTGYLVGGISPFGTKQAISSVMEESLMACDHVLINAGQRGTMLKMTPADIVAALKAQVASIV
ncbi:MAG: Cys-tRNA(Pro) deacylase [Desulfobacterales bacterium]|nr:Cys-tRNA(Pro) deacylase [Desulfobacterales bacterium]